jgi:hypothetical protein
MDLKQHLLRQMAFSHATFGPGARRNGVLDHIKKEMVEVEQAKTSHERAKEWVDIVILAFDGLTRELTYLDGVERHPNPEVAAHEAVVMIISKQSRNEGRDWPDWRTAPANKGIEHVRRPIYATNASTGEIEIIDADRPD